MSTTTWHAITHRINSEYLSECAPGAGLAAARTLRRAPPTWPGLATASKCIPKFARVENMSRPRGDQDLVASCVSWAGAPVLIKRLTCSLHGCTGGLDLLPLMAALPLPLPLATIHKLCAAPPHRRWARSFAAEREGWRSGPGPSESGDTRRQAQPPPRGPRPAPSWMELAGRPQDRCGRGCQCSVV